MNTSLTSGILSSLLLAAPAACPAVTFFNDTFTGGSTVNATPVSPTFTSTSYEIVSSKNWSPTPSLTSGDLKFGIASTSAGSIEAQALFTNSPVAMVLPGDYLEMTITFTDTTGLLTGNGFLYVGLYNSGQVFPVTNGINATAVNSSSDHATGGAAGWIGYVGQLAFSGLTPPNCRIATRPAQTGLDNRNQDLITQGSSSQSYQNAVILTTSTTNGVTLTAAQVYTEDIKITLSSSNTLYITNAIYSGSSATGTPLSQFGAEASGANLITTSFDALAIGWRETGSQATTIDISNIQVTGQSTPVTSPPSIDSQPVSVTVPPGGSCAFSVSATGFGMTYQWHRNGTNLVNGGNISGATSSTLVISPASAADAASGANGYYVTVTGVGPYSTNSAIASLTLGTAKNLVWAGTDTKWDLNTTADWLDSGNPATFDYGDAVTFDDTASLKTVRLMDKFLSASSVIVQGNGAYTFAANSPGGFAGPGKLIYSGANSLLLANANTYSGGTIVSNSSAYLIVSNYAGLGTGPVTLAQAGGQMEVGVAGSATVGIPGDIIVQDDFGITYDMTDAFGLVLLGNLYGTNGKTLMLHTLATTNVSRVRLYGGNTACDANIELSEDKVLFASYNGTGGQVFNGVISGNGSFMEKGTETIFNGANTYSGGTTPAQGVIGLGIDSVGSPSVTSGPIGTGPLYLAPDSTTSLTGTGWLLASGGARTIANAIQYRSGTNNLTLAIGGTNGLTLSGPITLNGNDSLGGPTNRIFQVTNTAPTTFAGVISDAAPGFGLVKTGSGILALNNSETYTGPTLISNGVLQVNGSLAAGSAVTVATNATLAGTGTINGTVTVQPGGTIAPGASIGTLTINTLALSGGNLAIEVNKGGAQTSDMVVVNGTLTGGSGTLTVTNLGPALAPGDTLTVFNKPVPGGSSMTVMGGGSAVTWTNKLQLDGTIAVASVVSTTRTNITFSVSGNNLTLGWPADHTGWALQAQTNAPSQGLGTNWATVPGSTSVNQVVMPINNANGSVFFRLVSP